MHHVGFSPDGKTIASECRVWDAASGKVLVAFRNQDGQNDGFANFYPIFYTPDGKRIISAESEGVRVWDIASGKEDHWVLRSPRFHFYAVALSPDGRFLARGGLVAPRRGVVDASIRLIEFASSKEVATFTGHEEGTRALAFSHDGRFLASGSGNNNSDRDAMVRVWDTGAGRERLRLSGHLAAINAVAFSDNGRSLVSGSADGAAIVWDVSDLRFDKRSHRPLAPQAHRGLWETLADASERPWAPSNADAILSRAAHPRLAVCRVRRGAGSLRDTLPMPPGTFARAARSHTNRCPTRPACPAILPRIAAVR